MKSQTTESTMPDSALIVQPERVEKSSRLPAENIASAATPIELLRIAVSQGADLDRLQKLMDLQDRWEATQSRKAYAAAMAQFKEHPPEILKDRHVSFQTDKGRVEYNHASLAAVCEAIIAGLSAVGITHRWVLDQTAGRVKVTCILTHVAGHTESTTLESGVDDSGKKNAIQAIGSAVAYLQRYTLLAATGLATREQDDDGKDANKAACINETQIADLDALITEVGSNKAQFLRYLKVDSLEQIPAASYKMVVGILEAKRRQVKK